MGEDLEIEVDLDDATMEFLREHGPVTFLLVEDVEVVAEVLFDCDGNEYIHLGLADDDD